jgi:D-xylose transport system substrate-binding protein
MRVGRRTSLSAVAVLGISIVVAACGGGGGSAGGGGSGRKIALLLPEHTTARYETQDRPNFVNQVKALCSDCTVIYENANQHASEQQSQADSVA